jgi:hypothetical protein
MSDVTVTADILDVGGEISPTRVSLSAVTGMTEKRWMPARESAVEGRHRTGDVLEPVG